MHCAFFAVAFDLARAGNSRPARIAMMAMTTSNSMRVNPSGPLLAGSRGLMRAESFHPPENRPPQFADRRSTIRSRCLVKAIVQGFQPIKLIRIRKSVILFGPESLLF